MLTQEDFVGPNMSGQAQQHLRRSSWKAEAIRRGDLKISGPIPITEDTPLNEDEEREYAEKYRMNAASPQRDEVAQPSAQRPQTPPPPVPPTMPTEPAPSTPAHGDSRPQKQEEQRESPPQRESPGSAARSTLLMARGSIAEHTINSAPSPFPSIPESNGKSGPKRKRKSGLRNVFRKMFGKKGRDELQEEEPEPEPVRRGHSYHMSEPGLIRRQTPEKKESPTTQRISDIPVEAIQPLNPLGQHLPFPMNVNAPQEASPPHEYLTFDAPRGDVGRRRATLPTLHVTGGETHSWNGSRERLQPWDERQESESQIGIALSSPPHAIQQSVQSKRRSRSAGALRDLAKGRPSIERRRSAEIRYWRDSHASGSIYSSNTRPQTARTVETVRTTGTNDTPTKAAESIVEITPAHTEPVVVAESQDPAELPLPVDAFNFGNLKSGFSDDEDSEEPAAASQAQKRLSIEDRVLHLEANVRTLENSVRRMSGRHNRQTIILENPPKGRRSSRNRSSSAASERLSLRSSGSNLALQGPAAQEATAAPRSPILAPLSAVNETSVKPSQAEVVLEQQQHQQQRPVTAIPRPDSTSSEYLAAIQDSLKHERSARKALERQVSTLQRELTDLQSLVNKLLLSPTTNANGNSMYPTPSPDTLISSNEERVSTPRAARPDHLEFRPDSELGYGPESVTSSREDVTSPEAFVTPKEESGFGSGFFRQQK